MFVVVLDCKKKYLNDIKLGSSRRFDIPLILIIIHYGGTRPRDRQRKEGIYNKSIQNLISQDTVCLFYNFKNDQS